MKMQLLRIIHNYFQVGKDYCVLEQSISVGRGQARGQRLSKPASKLQHAAQLYKFHVERREGSLLLTSRFQYTRLSTKSPPPPKLFPTIVCKSSLQLVESGKKCIAAWAAGVRLVTLECTPGLHTLQKLLWSNTRDNMLHVCEILFSCSCAAGPRSWIKTAFLDLAGQYITWLGESCTYWISLTGHAFLQNQHRVEPTKGYSIQNLMWNPNQI